MSDERSRDGNRGLVQSYSLTEVIEFLEIFESRHGETCFEGREGCRRIGGSKRAIAANL